MGKRRHLARATSTIVGKRNLPEPVGGRGGGREEAVDGHPLQASAGWCALVCSVGSFGTNGVLQSNIFMFTFGVSVLADIYTAALVGGDGSGGGSDVPRRREEAR